MRVSLPKGWDRRCEHCQSLLGYSQTYDAMFCPGCDTWLEPPCDDPSCWAACSRRPEKPSQGDIAPAPQEAE